jgi:two-component system sensor histidine kinase HupT/HoxJ
MPPPRPPPDTAGHEALQGRSQVEGLDDSTWLDVIRKMDEVYSQLVQDEIALEEKNAQLEQSQQFIFSLLTAMSDVLVACDEAGRIEETNAALCELVGPPARSASARRWPACRAAAARWRSTCATRTISRCRWT